VFRILGKVEIIGLENIPKEGAYIVAPNHISIYDGPLVAVFWPVPPEIAGAKIIWDKPGQAQLARMWGGIKVHRGQYDRRLIDKVLSVLQSGFPLLLAPEGTRSRSLGMQRANPGIAYLTDKVRVPVIPVGVFGSTVDFMEKALRGKRPLIGMNIGKPITFPPLEGKGSIRRKMRQQNADLVMAHVAALLPEDYRGVYATHDVFIGEQKASLEILTSEK
jgi:1-acyl-sn-glycerol-3-phosphate acyltransferase